MALLTVMLVSMLACALMAGVFAALAADQRSLGFDRDQSQAYAAAHAGLEKLTTQLAQLFEADFSPNAAQISTASATAPSIYGFNFTGPGGGSGYKVDFIADPCATCPNKGNPMPSPSNDITTGPFAGLKGLITPYTLTVTARSGGGGSEVRLRREVQTVAVPVFQFGVFGERSLSFHAGNDMEFAGRVHTNGHLFLAAGGGAITTFHEKLTAVGEVIRAELENQNPITDSGHTGTVKIPTVVGSSYRNLAASEGSRVGGPTSSAVSGWKNLSEAIYKTNVRNTMTGAKPLQLPLVRQGEQPIALIRRPEVNSNENTTNPPLFGQRFFAQASLRILLSDRASDITNLPTVTATAPIPLDGTWNPGGGRPPVARSYGPAPVNNTTVQATSGTGTSGTGVITINTAFPDWLRMNAATAAAVPTFTFGGVTVSGCTGMTATTLTGCTTSGTTPANTNAAAPLNLHASLGGGTLTLRTTSASSPSGSGSGKTVNVVTTNGLAWATPARVLWTTTGRSPITCTGYNAAGTTRQLTGCYWQTAPPNNSTLTTNALSDAGQSLLGGFIKIERQNLPGPGGVPSWTDVTADILGLGFAGPNQEGAICADPTADAVLRMQRLRDSGANAPCVIAGSTVASDYWPNVLFDAREATFRDQATTAAMTMGGVMNFVAIDVRNLGRWFRGEIGAMGGAAVLNTNGYIVYFSDRRGNHDWDEANDRETGEYGNEDSVNSSGGAGPTDPAPNGGAPEGGEDRNENGTLQKYGERVEDLYGIVPDGAPTAANVPFGTGATPRTPINNPGEARVNKQVLFRRALKLFNAGISGGVNNASMSLDPAGAGLTVATENGVYVQGNYNATSNNADAEPNVPAAILADSIVILSNNWRDVNSLNGPNDRAARVATETAYRFGMVAGKSIPFQIPGWATLGNWGTDGGVHNFMRMLEDWGDTTTHYRGSMVSLYTARQFIGIFKNNSNVYLQGERDFSFDLDFLNPFLLPPGTPMFRDVNTLRFRQILRPNQ
jgi:hypothetical protein